MSTDQQEFDLEEFIEYLQTIQPKFDKLPANKVQETLARIETFKQQTNNGNDFDGEEGRIIRQMVDKVEEKMNHRLAELGPQKMAAAEQPAPLSPSRIGAATIAAGTAAATATNNAKDRLLGMFKKKQ